MSKKTHRRQVAIRDRRPKRQFVISVGAVVSLFAGWTLLAYSGALDPLLKHKGTNAASVAIPNFNSNSPSKEYIYAGGRLLATEESGGIQSTGTKAQFDFDGDLKANVSVFRPSNGTWWILNPDDSQTVVGWGITGDKLVPADYDGDGKCDVAVFRPSDGTWWVKKSMEGDFSKQFAVTGDIPVPSAFIQQ